MSLSATIQVRTFTETAEENQKAPLSLQQIIASYRTPDGETFPPIPMYDVPEHLPYPPNIEKISAHAYTLPLLISGFWHPEGVQIRFIVIYPHIDLPPDIEGRIVNVEFRMGLTNTNSLELTYRILDTIEQVYWYDEDLIWMVQSAVEWIETQDQLDALLKSLEEESQIEVLLKELRAGIVL